MKNWLSRNKYKIIILPVVLLLGIFIGGCTNNEAKANSQDVFDDASFSSELVVDKGTKVEYIVVKRGINVYGITPHLNSDGKPIVKE